MEHGRTKGVFSLSTLGWVYFLLSQWGVEYGVRREKNSFRALHLQPAPEPHAGNSVSASSDYLRSLRWSVFTAVYLVSVLR